jgi:site-specific DNA-methyltransferase (adenine-specific)
MITSFFKSTDKAFTLLKGDCVELLNQFDFKFDMIFADPPYFLSNDGISVQSGKMVSVNKGVWDRSNGFEKDNEFNLNWLKACKEHLTDNGTIWISGTFHNIFSVAQMLTELDYKILNCITWAKTNPPPNLSCRYFTHSTEFIIWARKSKKFSHFYNYELMKTINGGTQMKDVWNLPAIAPWEKSCGKHPTQKPLALLTRIILASTEKNGWILDPFTGSSSTGIAANLANRKFLGIDKVEEFLSISKNRKLEIENPQIFGTYRKKLGGFEDKNQLKLFLAEEPEIEYERSLNFDKITASP